MLPTGGLKSTTMAPSASLDSQRLLKKASNWNVMTGKATRPKYGLIEHHLQDIIENQL